MSNRMLGRGRGMTAAMVRPGEPIEISDGVPIYCLPTQPRRAAAQNLGAAVIQSDPAVEHAATEVGFSPKPELLRAPDVAVLPGPPKDGWLEEAPPLVIEYADRGQDRADLRKKIREYLEHGVRHVWVVRLDGPHRVEVYLPGADKKETFGPGQVLLAPGVLANPVPVEALYDPQAAHETVLKNILAKSGYTSLGAVFDEGHAAGRAEWVVEGRALGVAEGRAEGFAEGLLIGLVNIYRARWGAPPEALLSAPTRDAATLQAWYPLFLTGTEAEIRAALQR